MVNLLIALVGFSNGIGCRSPQRVSHGDSIMEFLPTCLVGIESVQPDRARCSADSRPGRTVLRSPCDTLLTPTTRLHSWAYGKRKRLISEVCR